MSQATSRPKFAPSLPASAAVEEEWTLIEPASGSRETWSWTDGESPAREAFRSLPLPAPGLRSLDPLLRLLSERSFRVELDRELERARNGGRTGCLAYLEVPELARLRARRGAEAGAGIIGQISELIRADAAPFELVGRDARDRFVLLLPGLNLAAARQRLEKLSGRIIAHRFAAGGEAARLTPAVGYAAFAAGDRSAAVPEAVPILRRALLALVVARSQLDLHPVRYDPAMEPEPGESATRCFPGSNSRTARWEWLRLPLQIMLTVLLGLFSPILLYAAWEVAVLDITGIVYLCLIVAMLSTAILIMIEGFLALRRIDPPEQPGAPYPTASAIIAAYLPNEAGTIVDTVEAFLRLEYPGALQVILAYNTPHDLPVQAALQAIARRDPRFLPRRVEASASKAQNVNAALTEVSGEFVGVFDADHHPDPDSFTRAWRWLSNGYDVVQGHCLVRNGDASWVARMVAVEFEAMYAVSHPGRARLHGFGVFGGSNGYWKTDLLQQTRMHSFMLTEDIDSSIRVVAAGYKIASDPYLVSRELAPVTLKALWHQRLRWAQGWFQVSYKHIDRGLKSPRLTVRQKLGLLHLLGWRELFPWLSLQILPILGYWVWWRGERLNWFVSLFVLTTLVMLSNQPAQICFAYRLADPEIRRRKGWFWFYLGASVLFYMEFKNLISRVAHVKELMREHRWIVTPRAQKPGRRK